MKEDQERTPLRTILQNFINHIESLEAERIEDSYEKEFQELKFFSEILKTSKQYHCSEGEKEVNRKKNRYKDILPFDNSRVVLEEYVGVPGSDYINANFIKGASGSPAYIASQGPLPHTVNDFWRMVVECEVQVIVMACNQEEAGKHKCENYWVQNEGEEKQFGMVTIRLLKASIVCPDFLVRTMLLKYTNCRSTTEERTVCQFHYSAWPDHGVPPLVRPLLDMVRLVRDTQASETLPVLVHCSAGCGRTGTICAIDYVFGLLRAGKLTKDFSLYNLVRDMRKQRIAMVQTKEQYILVHQAVRELFSEQLRMIDAHPYENIDANGMPLIKEPVYDTIITCPVNQEENIEKQDEKEKEKPTITVQHESSSVEAPPLPHKKRLHVATSKQEKEVENLTEKRRCAIEQSSGSDSGSASSGMGSLLSRPRIAKLKALFERNSSTRESRGSRRRCGSQQVTRSHSLGPVRKAEADAEWRPIPGAGILRVPQLSTSVKPALPVKRSKSLRVAGSGERQQLSLLGTENVQEVAPVGTCDVVLVKNKCVANISSASVSDKKPSVPPKSLLTNRHLKTSDRVQTWEGPGPPWWRSYENVPVALRRRHSLESVILDDIAPAVDLNIAQKGDYVNVGTSLSSGNRKFQNPSSMDKGAKKILEDCRDYLVNSFQSISTPVGEKRTTKFNDVLRSDELKHLSVEAQRKVKAMVAGLGVRERRNSFRQAVDMCRVKDYEAIWPNRKDVAQTSMYPLCIASESCCNPTSAGQKYESVQGVYKVKGDELFSASHKHSDKFKALNHSVKSLPQKCGGSLRIKGTQVLSYAKEDDIKVTSGMKQYGNVLMKNDGNVAMNFMNSEIKTTPEGRYKTCPIQPVRSYRVHPRSIADVCRSNTDHVTTQGVYMKQRSCPDQLYRELPSNCASPAVKSTHNWCHISHHNVERGNATSKQGGLVFQDSSVPQTSSSAKIINPSVALNSNPLSGQFKFNRISAKVFDPRVPRISNTQECDDHSRSPNTMLKQMTRNPVPTARTMYGTSMSSPVAERPADEDRQTNTASAASCAGCLEAGPQAAGMGWGASCAWTGVDVDVDVVAASIKSDQASAVAQALESLHMRRASQRTGTSQPAPNSQGFSPSALPVKKQHYL